MELAFALAEARRDAGLTQAKVSRLMRTSQAAVARLESGRAKPTWDTIERFARAVGRRAVVKLERVEEAGADREGGTGENVLAFKPPAKPPR